MILTLNDVLRLGRLNECKVVSGHNGVTRKVTSVTILEVPEVTKWLKHGELLLTSLYNLQHEEEFLKSLILEINSIGAAGLAIKPSNYKGDIPEVILLEAEKLSLPIIFIPEHINYAEILYPVVHRLFNDKVILQEDVNLATLAMEESLINGANIHDFLEELEGILQATVTIESYLPKFNYKLSNLTFGNLTSKEISELQKQKKPLTTERKSDSKIMNCLVAPLLVEGNYTGNITIWDINENMIPFDYAVLEKASSLLSIELLKIIIEQEIKINHENDFLREILFSTNFQQRYLKEFSEAFNIDNEISYFCILIEADQNDLFNASSIQDSKLYSFIKEDTKNVIVGRIEKYYCIIRSSDYDKNKIEEYCKKIHSNFLNIVKSFSVGEKQTGLRGIQQSFEQAKYAMNFVDISTIDVKMALYSELGAYKLINIWDGREELDEFYETVFGQLILDRKSEELINTLNHYFLNDGGMKKSSEKLFIHINTLKYRIKKIEQLTGNRLSSSEGNFNIYLALKIHNLLK